MEMDNLEYNQYELAYTQTRALKYQMGEVDTSLSLKEQKELLKDIHARAQAILLWAETYLGEEE